MRVNCSHFAVAITDLIKKWHLICLSTNEEDIITTSHLVRRARYAWSYSHTQEVTDYIALSTTFHVRLPLFTHKQTESSFWKFVLILRTVTNSFTLRARNDHTNWSTMHCVSVWPVSSVRLELEVVQARIVAPDIYYSHHCAGFPVLLAFSQRTYAIE